MKHNKLYQLLTSFDERDWTNAEDFIQSPFFNKNNRCIELFLVLKEKFKNKGNTSFETQELSQLLFKNNKNPEKYLRVVMVQLTQLLEQFLIQQELQNHPIYEENLLNKNLLNRKLYGHFLSLYRKKKRQEEKEGKLQSIDLERCQSDFYWALDYQNYLHSVQSRNIEQTPVKASIQALDRYFLLHRLQLMIEQISIAQLSQPEVEMPVLPVLYQLIQVSHLSESKLLELYYLAVQVLLSPPTNNAFEKLYERLETYAPFISKNELHILFTVLINYSIMTQKGRKSNNRLVFDLYKKMVQYEVFRVQGYISEGKFKNIVTLGCHFSEFEWTEVFIEKYYHFLDSTHRQSIYHFNKGAFHFFKKDFDTAQEHLSKVEQFELFYTIDTKGLLIRIYQEKGEDMAAFRALHAFRNFVRKQRQLPANIKKSYLNFANMLLKINAEKEKYQNRATLKNRLLKKLEAYALIYHKEWLRGQIGLL